MLGALFPGIRIGLKFELNLSSEMNYTANKKLQSMFAELFQRQENKVK